MRPITDTVGNGSTTLQVSYLPDASVDSGTIGWTAVVEDGNPDVDEASATTLVRSAFSKINHGTGFVPVPLLYDSVNDVMRRSCAGQQV